MQQRGTGDLAGAKQWGVSDLAMEAPRNLKMVEVARLEARNLIETDPDLKITPPRQIPHFKNSSAYGIKVRGEGFEPPDRTSISRLLYQLI